MPGDAKMQRKYIIDKLADFQNPLHVNLLEIRNMQTQAESTRIYDIIYFPHHSYGKYPWNNFVEKDENNVL